MKSIKLSAAAPWVEQPAPPSAWKSADAGLLQTMLVNLHLIRAFEEAVLDLVGKGLVHGPAHSSIGQEGGAVASAMPLRGADQINGSHRAHHQFLAKALQYLHPNGVDPAAPIDADTQALLQRTLAEIMGLAQGFCRGRGGSMHLRWAEAGVLGTNAIVGGGVPMAAGAAWAHRRAGNGDVAVTYFGDGAINIGSVLETMNLAAAWQLPLCFFIENNRYAVSTEVSEVTAEPRLSSRGPAFGIPSWKVDGMDPLAVFLAMSEAVEHMRAGKGPTVIEADVYRFFHQNGPLPGSAFGYRSRDEEGEWRARDPLDRLAREMISLGHIDEAGVEALRGQAVVAMERASAELMDSSGEKPAIIASLWPAPDFRDTHIRGDLSELDDARYVEQADYTGTLEARRFVDTVADVMHRRMSTDERIVVMGEDVHRLKGGTNGATRGLSEDFPDRCLGTPISENAFAGLGGGIAMDGRYRPVVEFMYPDFMWVAADQVFNQIAKARHMFGGDIAMPLVLRTKVAMGTGYGSQHSMDPAGIFATSPGWRIVAPSNPYDYVGLMNSALQCEDPVLVIEHTDLYTQRFEAPVDDLDYFIPLGGAKVVRPGSDVTVISYLSMVERACEAADQLGVDAEVIDLRSLDRAGIDWDTLEASIRRTNNVLVVEQGPIGTAYGALLGDEIQRRFMDWLDQPVQRVYGGEASPSISKVLERAACAGREELEAGLRTIMAAQGRPIAAS
jgi:2-oxoisovalerate dehydrogenase E1 component